MSKLAVVMVCVACGAGLLVTGTARAGVELGTAFAYQGQLKQNGQPMEGTADLVIMLYDDPAAGAQVGPTVTKPAHPVENGLFTVSLDFGQDAFNGEARWLAITVNGETLAPRQPISPTPYALCAVQAAGL